MDEPEVKVAPGQEIPPFTRQTGLHNWNRFAAVNDEFVSYHMDDAAGRAAGYDGAFGMGNLQWAYLHCLLRQWLGPRGRVLAVSCQFRAPDTGGTLTSRGVVREVRTRDGRLLADLDVWTEDKDGTRLAPGTATVEVFR